MSERARARSEDEPLGALCFVLHGHLPYVLHHGSWPHGEAWLFEAAAEVYLPLLDVLDELVRHRVRPGMTVGLTPVLLEQLAHERFKAGFVAYLAERGERAIRDRRAFERRQQPDMSALAERWEYWFADRLAHFERIGRDIPAQFAAFARAGQIEILTSTATHAYTPLLLNDQSIRAQFALGAATTKRRLGLDCRGMWLPECAYRPTWEHWLPPVLQGEARYADARYRVGLEHFMAEAGIDHFFVDTHLVREATPLAVAEDGWQREVVEAQVYWDVKRGWRDPLQPVGVVSELEKPRAFAFARHPKVNEQVWSGSIGYPASGEYLDFHHKFPDPRGLRYHRITDTSIPPERKESYEPERAFTKLYEHVQHFCKLVKDALRDFRGRTGKAGVCVAPFDAELFGHWWFEGPQFLRDVAYTLSRDKSVELLTSQEALDRWPPDKVVRLPEGSWGEQGNHSVWMNDRTKWMWEVEYRAEDRLQDLAHGLPWQANAPVRQMLERAARELLLLQASDWAFVIHTEGATDYGIQRFAGHATRFQRLCDAAEMLARGEELGRLERVQVEEAELHDDVFPDIDLGWWM